MQFPLFAAASDCEVREVVRLEHAAVDYGQPLSNYGRGICRLLLHALRHALRILACGHGVCLERWSFRTVLVRGENKVSTKMNESTHSRQQCASLDEVTLAAVTIRSGEEGTALDQGQAPN